ncbi:hypothetical protein H4R21_005055, partial [Coemansia helicoidea]
LVHPRIPGGSTASSEFDPVAPVAEPIAVNLPVADPAGDAAGNDGDDDDDGEHRLEVPEHWHLFPSAVVSVKDLLVATGKAGARLALDTSDEDACSVISELSLASDEIDGLSADPDSAPAAADDGSDHLAQDISKALVE